MCVHFLRKRATRKANALLRCIPAGVVIVDAKLHIIECNEHFARLFGEDTLMARNGAAEARNSASVTAETPRAARTSRAAGWSARNRLTGRRRLIRAAGETEEAEGEDASGGQRAGPLAIP